VAAKKTALYVFVKIGGSVAGVKKRAWEGKEEGGGREVRTRLLEVEEGGRANITRDDRFSV